jgi:hypothetical protein
MTAQQMVEPLYPPVGVTQNELVDFGAALRGIGLDETSITAITHKLGTIANEAAYKGSAAMALTIRQVRQDERLRWEQYTAAVLRDVLQTVLSMRGLMGYVDKLTVQAAIQQAIAKQEATVLPRLIEG